MEGGVTSENINEISDVFNIYDLNNEKIAKLYINGYQHFTTEKAPTNFILQKK